MTDVLRTALLAVEGKKAADVVVLDISKIATFASYFLLCTGESSRQIQAIADEVEEQLRKQGHRPNHIEGYRNAEWVLMDYLDLVIHVFSRSARSYYDLERLWRDGRRLDTSRLLRSERPKKGARTRSKKEKLR